MPYITVSTDVDVDISEFETDELVKELERRVSGVTKELLETHYPKRRQGKDYQAELDQLIWMGLGKVI